jgi:hypothetical protein
MRELVVPDLQPPQAIRVYITERLMHITSLITQLEQVWDFDTGFFGRLRRGEFDSASLGGVPLD